MISLLCANEKETVQLGYDLSLILQAGDLLALSGELGAGKSVLARAIIRALADNSELEVPSPTYTICNLYDTPLPIAHFDLYRLADRDELAELGLDDLLDAGCAIIEWPERGFDILPDCAVSIGIKQETESGRLITIDGNPEMLSRISRTIEIRKFLTDAGMGTAIRGAMSADASARRYEIVTQESGTHLYLMDAPRMPDGPPVRDGKPYSQIAHLAEDMTAFVAIGQLLESHNLGAPNIPAFDLEKGLALIEDLGAEFVIDQDRNPIPERYTAAAEYLAYMHCIEFDHEFAVSDGTPYAIPDYDPDAMMIEVELLTDWYVPFVKGNEISDADRAEFRSIWSDLFKQLSDQDKSLVLRDFHSPNILWRGEQQGHKRIGVIDFQDALIGPTAYDVASLAQDARVDVSPALELEVFETYLKKSEQLQPGFDRIRFECGYRIMAAQRVTKILGIFVRLKQRDGKEQYLQHLPRMQEYLSRSLTHPVLARYREWCASVIEL